MKFESITRQVTVQEYRLTFGEEGRELLHEVLSRYVEAPDEHPESHQELALDIIQMIVPRRPTGG